ncbi:BA75_01396T0 [Komagataella pastoris]|uniref:BA75_01396T0 n=1 Tax=Komagataella pastoris TaxID=4922 RepID=A0A1B2J7P2_PICPA|nr:BA75_01396T0 [Komagataella pastoris]
MPSQSLANFPIHTLFLTKFDVRKGYDLIWIKSVDQSLTQNESFITDLEYKSFPSGLHSVSKDSLQFVMFQPNNTLLYGISIFRQNGLFSEQISHDRSKVLMYSLGILIDPSELNDSYISTVTSSRYHTWIPHIYSSCWNYYNVLESLFDEIVPSDDLNDEIDSLLLDSTFEKYHYKTSSDKFKEAIKSLNKKPSIITLEDEESVPPNPDHMILSMQDTVATLGPLIFPLWKLSLLREPVLIYGGSSVEKMNKISYHMSILSIIPLELQNELIKSLQRLTNSDTDHHDSVNQFQTLQYYQLLYNICLKDVSSIPSFVAVRKTGFIASTRDVILLENPLFTSTVKLPENNLAVASISTSAATNNEFSFCTRRDSRKFDILQNFISLQQGEPENQKDYSKCVEHQSWSEYLYKIFKWWASAGEDIELQDVELLKEDLLKIFRYTDEPDSVTNSSDLTSPSIYIVEYFQQQTRKIFEVLIQIINCHLQDRKSDHLIIEYNDIYEMGLDPYSSQDSEFVIALIHKIWCRNDPELIEKLNVKIGYFFTLC